MHTCDLCGGANTNAHYGYCDPCTTHRANNLAKWYEQMAEGNR